MRVFRNRSGVCLCVWLLVGMFSAQAEVTLPSVFGDHMVLQQGQEAPVWGWADPGERITVKLGRQKASGVADADGQWQVRLRPVKAGGPTKMTVKGNEDKIVFDDVLVGEVWVCSGQSNMQWSVENSNNPKLEIAMADHPHIRLFSVPRVVAGETQTDCDAEWTVCSPKTIRSFSALAYFFGRELQTELDVPVGLIHTSWGGTPAESWTTLSSLKSDPLFTPIVERWDKILADYPQAKAAFDEKLAAWQAAAEKAKAEGAPAPQRPQPPWGPDHPWRASGLYNAMIAPLIPYAIQGAIWYQGESNAGRAFQYRRLFPQMIQDWRAAWDQGPFPFLFVQLASFSKREPEPGDSDWAELREAQLMTLELPNAGMAVTIDIGQAEDIHPRNKQEVGRRLALDALANTYGRDVPYSGPMYESMAVRDNEVDLYFIHMDYGLQAMDMGRLKGFAVAGADGQFVWANARIERDKVVVSADAVPEPVAVRYGWAINPDCNLANGVGLPASPFRTDDWPCVTADAR